MKERGYSTKRYNTLYTAYHNKPTELQRASYDVYLINLVKQNAISELNDIFHCKVSPNPCNNYGESLVHMICRRGEILLLQMLLQHGCTVQIADDYGRTPLHDACWAANPAFDVVTTLLNMDVTLLQMSDCRGFLPLSYVRKDHWNQWNTYIDSIKDTYFPILSYQNGIPSTTTDGSTIAVTQLVDQAPNTRLIPDPENALSFDLANMVVSGKMKPKEALYLQDLRIKKKAMDEKAEHDVEDDDDDDDSSDSDSNSSDDSDSDDSESESDDDDEASCTDSNTEDDDEDDEDNDEAALEKDLQNMLGHYVKK